MKSQKGSAVLPKRVQTFKSASERRAERQLDQALSHPELVEDWDELDYALYEQKNHKVVLE